MTTFMVMLSSWLATGAFGVYTASRGSYRYYGKDMYYNTPAGKVMAALTILAGLVGLLGTMVAW